MTTQTFTLTAFLLCTTMLSQASYSQWTQQGPKLVGTGVVFGISYQGYSVSISSDGNTAIVGGIYDDAETGAAWVFTRSGGAWTQQGSKLVGTGAVGDARQGMSVSISSDGNTAIVGGGQDNSYTGAAWVFTRSGGVWTQQGPKLVGTGAVGDAQQGSSVSISSDGNTAIIGGYDDNSFTGAAWVFTRNGGVWTQQGSKLVGTGGVGTSYQGNSVSISSDGNTAIVGGIGDNSFNGAAWVFTRSGGVWSQQGPKLVGTGGVGTSNQGISVSISSEGNTAIVGGAYDNSQTGAAWVFTRSGGVWAQQGTKLVGTGAVGNAGQGISVSISSDGNTAIVGGYVDNSGTGAAWMFTRSGGVWTQQGTKLVGTGAVGNAVQGRAVSISSDGNTAIVGGYADNSFIGAAWIFSKKGLSITRPQAGERWMGGDQDTIRWTGGQPGRFVDIQLSTDSGATYSQVDIGIPADSGKYIWLVPDSLTTRAKTRLFDTATQDSLAVSDTFKIKRYALTRMNARGQYEQFTPPNHGWSFVNANANFWPAPWYGQFQYAGGIDRHTGEPFDPMFSGIPGQALPAHFPDWPVFADVFARDSCYYPATNTPRVFSVAYWSWNKTQFSGSCFGVVQSALLYFHYQQQFRQRHPIVPATDSLASLLTMTDSIRIIINRYFTIQFGALKKNHDIANQATTPRQVLQRVRQMWANDDPSDDAGLKYRDTLGSGGHAVIPYRLQRSTTNPVQFQLFVCNSNSPQSMNDFILIDSLTNRWQEFTGFGWNSWSVQMFLYPPALSFFSPTILPFGPVSSIEHQATQQGLGRIEIGTPWRSDVRILSPGGDSIGVRNGRAFNTTSEGMPLIPETGGPQPPLGYDLAAGAYRIRVSNATDSVIAVSVRRDSLSITLFRSSVQSTEQDDLWYDGGVGMRNSDGVQKQISFQIAAWDRHSDKTTSIEEATIGQHDSVSTSVDALSRAQFKNYGPAKSYRLRLRHGSQQGARRFESGTLSVPAQSSHIFVANWDSLTTSTVRIYVDLGNNGTIDDTLVVNNTLDVDDRGSLEMPAEYNLAQNYPNPFNPTTRIEYALPRASRVKLTVYNLLGQLVATLVDEDRPAGRFAAEWNGKTTNGNSVGSGVYFYTMLAQGNAGGQTFARTGKMLLLR